MKPKPPEMRFWSAALGVVAMFAGSTAFALWDSIGPALARYYVISGVAGLALLIAGRLAVRPATAAVMATAGLLAVNQLGGMIWSVIPCSGPT